MKLSKKDNVIRKEIFERITQLFLLRKMRDVFIPGESMINYAGRVYDERELIKLVDASLDFWLTSGKYAQEFERSLSAFLGVKHCLLVNSGSSANLLAMSTLTSPLLKHRRLRPHDEVITTACGFPTTLNPILQNGLTPVFIDIDIGSFNVNAAMVEQAISKRTKAICLPHTLGNPLAVDEILRVSRKHNLWFVEDNCDALGSRYKKRFTGTFGHISTSSFYPAHHITTGEGGAVLTNDPLLKRILLSLRDWGRDCWCEPGHDNTCKKRFSQSFGRLPYGYDHKYVYSHIGYNLKATDMQAAIGVAQMQKLPKFIKLRRRNFDYLYRHLCSYEQFFILPRAENFSEPSWFGFPLLVREKAPFDRAEIVDYLERHKIATRMLFGGNLLKQPAYAHMKCRVCGSLKNTDLVMSNLFWIGVYPGLTKQELKYTLEIFDRFLSKFKS
ncbi:MAG: lipopolysaccharide biosynthesis protein RfbH [Candidatus Margulisiibacteriota bacterium]